MHITQNLLHVEWKPQDVPILRPTDTTETVLRDGWTVVLSIF